MEAYRTGKDRQSVPWRQWRGALNSVLGIPGEAPENT